MVVGVENIVVKGIVLFWPYKEREQGTQNLGRQIFETKDQLENFLPTFYVPFLTNLLL